MSTCGATLAQAACRLDLALATICANRRGSSLRATLQACRSNSLFVSLCRPPIKSPALIPQANPFSFSKLACAVAERAAVRSCSGAFYLSFFTPAVKIFAANCLCSDCEVVGSWWDHKLRVAAAHKRQLPAWRLRAKHMALEMTDAWHTHTHTHTCNLEANCTVGWAHGWLQLNLGQVGRKILVYFFICRWLKSRTLQTKTPPRLHDVQLG